MWNTNWSTNGGTVHAAEITTNVGYGDYHEIELTMDLLVEATTDAFTVNVDEMVAHVSMKFGGPSIGMDEARALAKQAVDRLLCVPAAQACHKAIGNIGEPISFSGTGG
jgi:hypothetical protein